MNLTLAFIAFIVIAITIFDFWVIFKKGRYESISYKIIDLSHKYPLIPFLLGIVSGHLFWSFRGLPEIP